MFRSTKKYDWLHWPLIVTFFVVFTLFFGRAFVYLDPDFGWHLTAGNYFLHHGFPATDIFTYTASNFPWVSHEWLNDIFVYLLHSLGGFTLLAVVFALIWTFVVWSAARKFPSVLVIIATLAVLPFSGVRTLTWSALLLVLLINVFQKYRTRKIIWSIPLLFLLWANLHGSFVVGLVYLAYQALRYRSWKILIMTILSTLATFINPYGYRVYSEVLSTLGDSTLHARIDEWQSFVIPAAAFSYVMVWLVVTVLGMKRTWRRGHSWKDWYQFARIDILFFIASILQARHLPLFVLVSLPYTAKGVAEIATKIPKHLDVARRRFIAIVAVVFGVVTIICVAWTFSGIHLQREATYPVKAASYIASHPCKGNMFNSYNYGGYLIWKAPDQKVYIDGRMPSWSMGSTKYMDNYLRFLNDASFRDAQIQQYDITCAVVADQDSVVINDLLTQGWKVKVKDTYSVFMTKN